MQETRCLETVDNYSQDLHTCEQCLGQESPIKHRHNFIFEKYYLLPCSVVQYIFTDVSDEPTVSIFWIEKQTKFISDYTVSHPSTWYIS
jgi:hypothetical protein